MNDEGQEPEARSQEPEGVAFNVITFNEIAFNGEVFKLSSPGS
jgi:hypothetical protein